MESSQRIATVVAVGLVVVASLVVVYLFNEPNRREASAEAKLEESADRGVALYLQYCLQCHGENGLAQGRQGIPLNTDQNQSAEASVWEQREPIIRNTIVRGRGTIMPAWGQSDGGPLNDEQVNDLVNMIHTGVWDKVEEQAIAQSGGVPTPPPLPTPEGGAPEDPLAAAGQTIYQNQCMACHTVNGDAGTGPTWLGIFGRDTPLEDGSTVTADEAYIKESILQPAAKVHQGFQPIMPPFQLSDDDINALIAYMKTLTQ